jgi:hypothetical protein
MTKEKESKKIGRPEQYTKKYADSLAPTLADMFEEGASLAEVCHKIGCCKESFYKMLEISPEFSYAYKKGMVASEAWWCTLGRAGSAGKHAIQAAPWIFNMKNRFGWKDKQEITGADNEPLFAAFAAAAKKALPDP